MSDEEDKRPKVAAEVRAWAIAAVTLVAQAMAAVWWAATLSAQMGALADKVADLTKRIEAGYTATDALRDMTPIRAQLADHEARIRVQENRR